MGTVRTIGAILTAASALAFVIAIARKNWSGILRDVDEEIRELR